MAVTLAAASDAPVRLRAEPADAGDKPTGQLPVEELSRATQREAAHGRSLRRGQAGLMP